MTAPKRIQRQRTKGWRMPEGAVYVGRPSKWGNPYRWDEYRSAHVDEDGERWPIPEERRRSFAVIDFRAAMDPEYGFGVGDYPDRETIRRELAGRDLACWCPLDQPCHADVLLELANGEVS